jgi:sugar lactone lactonase YvrE
MEHHAGRFPAPAIEVAEGWVVERLTPPSRLHGANGMMPGPDGRIYVAECMGSRISALDMATGELEVVSPTGSDVVGPDDLVFDDRGRMYITEFMDARVSVREPDGRTRVLRDDLPGANGITMHRGRLFVDECRPGGRLLELDLAGGAPRVLLDGLTLPNALAPGPDGLLYFPLVGADEIWRVDPDGGAAQRVAAGLDRPTAVKFDADGMLVSPQSRTGEILRIDPRSGRRRRQAMLEPGLDNVTFAGGHLVVSFQVNGRVAEVLDDGTVRDVVPRGLIGPYGLAVAPDGTVCVADHAACYAIAPDGHVRCLATMSGSPPGYPGGVRGIALRDDGTWAVSTSNGKAAIYDPRRNEHLLLTDRLDQPYGVCTDGDRLVVAELGRGRVVAVDGGGVLHTLAGGLAEPIDVARSGDGRCFVSESGAGRVVDVSGGRAETVVDGLAAPQGIATRDDTLLVVDAGQHAVVAVDLRDGRVTTLASGLPIGAPPGVVPKPLRGAPPFAGPLHPFAGIAIGDGGSCYVAADTDGSVVALRQIA